MVTGGLAGVVAGFAICALIILVAGTRLTHYGDVIAEKTGIGRSWIGLFLIAAVTSLPELITSASSILALNEPDIAVGDVLGSTMFNLLIAAGVGLALVRGITRAEARAQRIAASYGLAMLALALAALLAASRFPVGAGLGIVSVALVVLYLVATRHVFTSERVREPAATMYDHVHPRHAAIRYTLSAIAVVAAGTALPFLAEAFAHDTGMPLTAVATTLVALMTSLPEIVVAVTALRMRAASLALGSLLGSNLFDLLILALDDLLYTAGPILAHISLLHATTLAASIAMTVIALAATYAQRRATWRLAWSLVIVAYLVATTRLLLA